MQCVRCFFPWLPDQHPRHEEVQQMLTFKENLERGCFLEASQQLIGREKRLFGSDHLAQAEEAELRQDYKTLLEEVRQMVGKSLQPLDQSAQDAMKEAVLAIKQEEEQDRKWEESVRQRRPDWRPCRWRHAHDSLLEEMVRERVQRAEPYPGGRSSIQSELIGLGRQIKQDLLQVARQVRSCYPGNWGVVQAYARLYHQAFSTRLQDIAEFGLDHQDCTYLLSWTNQHYPNIFREPELVSEVNLELLEPLLPADMMRPLVEQYLEHILTDLQGYLQNALMKEEQAWKSGAIPEMIDGYYCCPLAIDVIQYVDEFLRSVQAILGGDMIYTHRMVATLTHFFSSYKDFLGKVMKQSGTRSRAVVMTNLTCLRMFREFLRKVPSKDVHTSCVSMVTSMQDSCHTHLTSFIHQNLKETYRKLWSNNWLQNSKRLCEQLRTGLHTHLLELRSLEYNSKQELLGVLHEEVLVEYVKNMMKRKIKLKDKKQQEQAAAALCDDNDKIHTLFTDAGSRVKWLSGVLPLLAEMLKLQDPDAICLQLLTLTRELPDISIEHVSALLHLKSGLSKQDCKKIKETFTELRQAQTTHTPACLFFSKVNLR